MPVYILLSYVITKKLLLAVRYYVRTLCVVFFLQKLGRQSVEEHRAVRPTVFAFQRSNPLHQRRHRQPRDLLLVVLRTRQQTGGSVLHVHRVRTGQETH